MYTCNLCKPDVLNCIPECDGCLRTSHTLAIKDKLHCKISSLVFRHLAATHGMLWFTYIYVVSMHGCLMINMLEYWYMYNLMQYYDRITR